MTLKFYVTLNIASVVKCQLPQCRRHCHQFYVYEHPWVERFFERVNSCEGSGQPAMP